MTSRMITALPTASGAGVRLRVLLMSACAHSMLWLVGIVVVLSAFGMRAIVIDGGSMAPAIRHGDVVLLGDIPSRGDAPLASGTVITFLSPARGDGSLLTHRVVEVAEDGSYITKGDANLTRDSDPVSGASLIGVGRVVVPFVGHPAVWLSKGQYLPLLAWLAGALVVVWAQRRPHGPGPRPVRPADGRRALPAGIRAGIRADGGAGRSGAILLATAATAGLVIMTALALSRASFWAATANPANPLGGDEWKRVVGLDAGTDHTCTVRAEGLAWCWGRNDRGQLGDASTTDRRSPVPVTGVGGTGLLSGLTGLAAGGSTSCAVGATGSAWCWGRNDFGQLGNQSTSDRSSPVAVKGAGGVGTLADVDHVAVGTSHSCAVRTSGDVWCWGRNDAGQLGRGNTTDSTVPVQVKGAGNVGTLSGAVAIGAGDKHTCAVLADTSLWCWGRNDKGQLGRGSTSDSTYPVQVTGPGGVGTLTGVVAVDGGLAFTCAAAADGAAWCWGDNPSGQLGNQSTSGSTTPVQVKGPGGVGVLTGVAEAVTGDQFACARRSDASAWCWGRNNVGQLGNDSTSDRTTPVQVKGEGGVGTLAGVALMGAGKEHVCAARTDWTVWCWGANKNGQLGDGTASDSGRSTPAPTGDAGWTGTFDVASLDAGGEHTCGVRGDATAWCWGANGSGQLGNRTTYRATAPSQVRGAGGVGALASVSTVAAGGDFTCARLADGTAWCWGSGADGRLGGGGTASSTAPAQVVGSGGAGTLANVSSLAAGGGFACALKGDGTVWCWGANSRGQLGEATTTSRSWPVQVKGVGGAGTLTGILAIGAGQDHACAVRADRSTVCWGANTTGQLGDGTTTDRTAPVVVLGTGGTGTLGSVAFVDGGESSTCARLTDLTARCWGANSQGQLGDNSTTQRLWPVQVKGVGGVGSLTGVSRLRVGNRHACAVNSSNVLRCWGDNDSGQLGVGSTTDSLAPAAVASPFNGDASTASGALGAGGQHTCSLRTSGAAWCWGANLGGQLGDGTVAGSTSPVPVIPA